MLWHSTPLPAEELRAGQTALSRSFEAGERQHGLMAIFGRPKAERPTSKFGSSELPVKLKEKVQKKKRKRFPSQVEPPEMARAVLLNRTSKAGGLFAWKK